MELFYSLLILQEERNALETEMGSKLLNIHEDFQTELAYQEEIHHRGWFEHVMRVNKLFFSLTKFKGFIMQTLVSKTFLYNKGPFLRTYPNKT